MVGLILNSCYEASKILKPKEKKKDSKITEGRKEKDTMVRKQCHCHLCIVSLKYISVNQINQYI